MKRILTVQDISCVGKCSLTVALPIISAMGIEAAVLPTAVLSTHTAFKKFTFHDLTDEMPTITSCWNEQNIEFDGLYSGYLGSVRQIDLVIDLYKAFGEGKLKLVDPAMADNGRLYAGFAPDFPLQMARLCSVADIVIPNLTEACFMLGEEYKAFGYGEEYIKKLLLGIVNLGAKKVVITGVAFEEGKLGCCGYDSEKNEFFSYFNNEITQKFHGTGDTFASVCFGSLISGSTLFDATKNAADFVCDAIKATLEDERPIDYGVHFEKVLYKLFPQSNEHANRLEGDLNL